MIRLLQSSHLSLNTHPHSCHHKTPNLVAVGLTEEEHTAIEEAHETDERGFPRICGCPPITARQNAEKRVARRGALAWYRHGRIRQADQLEGRQRLCVRQRLMVVRLEGRRVFQVNCGSVVREP